MRGWPHLILIAVACGSPPTGSVEGRWKGPAGLAYVPADTPYVVATLDPMTDDVQEYLFGRAARDLAALVPEAPAVWNPDEPDATGPQVMLRAAANELRGKDRARWWADLGLARDAHLIVYGYGVWPVVRVELGDPARMAAALTRVLGAPQGENWRLDLGAATAAVAIEDHEVVATVVARSRADALVPHVLHDRPARSLASTNALVELAVRHHLETSYLGYIDTHASIAAFADLDMPELADVQACRADLDRFAALMPRIVLGYSHIDATHIDARGIVELAPELARELRAMHAKVTTPPSDARDPLVSFGAALDLDATVAWLRASSHAVVAPPFACPALRELDTAFAKLDGELAKPLPALLHGSAGFSMVMDEVHESPPSGRGYVVAVGDQIDALVALAQQLPQLAGVSLGGGKPVALPVAQLGLPRLTAYAAVAHDRVVVAVGDDSERRASEVLAAPARPHSPLVEISMDVPKLDALFPNSALRRGFNAVVDQQRLTVDVVDDDLVVEMHATWHR